MINLILLVLYLIIVFVYLIISLFIAYHLATYSINSELRIMMLSFFVIVSTGLLLSNLALFFSMDWNIIINQILS